MKMPAIDERSANEFHHDCLSEYAVMRLMVPRGAACVVGLVDEYG